MNRIEKLVVGTILAIIVVIVSGCSFKVEFGYHGETGRDDRVQTQLKHEKKVVNVRE